MIDLRLAEISLRWRTLGYHFMMVYRLATFQGVLPLMLKTCLLECFLKAASSENAARRMAMLRATESADNIGKNLTLRYHRARQDHATSELIDIIGAAEALRNR